MARIGINVDIQPDTRQGMSRFFLVCRAQEQVPRKMAMNPNVFSKLFAKLQTSALMVF